MEGGWVITFKDGTREILTDKVFEYFQSGLYRSKRDAEVYRRFFDINHALAMFPDAKVVEELPEAKDQIIKDLREAVERYRKNGGRWEQ